MGGVLSLSVGAKVPSELSMTSSVLFYQILRVRACWVIQLLGSSVLLVN